MVDPFSVLGDAVLDPAANPFKPGVGKVPPAFGGREESLGLAAVIVRRLQASADPSFLLVRGVRGIGKTALLAYVRRQAAPRGIVTVRLEADRGLSDHGPIVRDLLHAADDLAADGLLARLARRIDGVTVGPTGIELSLGSSTVTTSTLEQTIAAIGAAAAERGRGVLLTVDEIQEAEDELFRPLVRALHGAAQEDQPIGLLAAGLPGAAEALLEEGQTYTERLDIVDLDFLDADGVVDAVRSPLVAAGLEVADEVLDAVVRDSAGYPYFVQVWGAALWDSATDPTAVTIDALGAARDLAHRRIDRFYASRAARLPTGRARRVVTALGRLGGTASTADLLTEAGVTNAQYGPVREALLGSGHVYAPERGRIAFSVPGFDTWLDRNPLDA